MNTPPGAAPEQPDDDARTNAGADPTPTPPPAAPVPMTPAPMAPAPMLPTQSREDTDVGWGDYPDRDDDDRLLRDRPPHWDNA
jgi:hypothetical protein